MELPPLSVRPSSSKEAPPVDRFTLARPLRTVHGSAPAWMVPTGLSAHGAVTTPTMFRQRTIESSRSNAKTEDAIIDFLGATRSRRGTSLFRARRGSPLNQRAALLR